jgi:hypothetical protein
MQHQEGKLVAENYKTLEEIVAATPLNTTTLHMRPAQFQEPAIRRPHPAVPQQKRLVPDQVSLCLGFRRCTVYGKAKGADYRLTEEM